MLKRLVLLGLIALSPAVWSQTPDPLKSWEAWAAAPFAYRQCAIKPGVPGHTPDQYACQWPGKLDLDLSDAGGQFEQSWMMDQAGTVALPGSDTHWPQNVRVDGAAVPVVDQNGVPVVRLPPGQHQVQGSWEWASLPSRLDIPAQTAWWSVDRPGLGVNTRQGNTLLLSDTSPAQDKPVATKDTANLRVFRKFTDAQVVQVQVLMEINVGGAPRELVLGPVVDPSQWVPIGVDSAWPVQWQADGTLVMQVQPGQTQVSLNLRCAKACDKPFSRPQSTPPWPQVEYWALESDPAFRIVSWEGAAVDPRQVQAPAAWQALPWVQVREKESAGWSVKSRGPTDKDAAMRLLRTGWLDFDGTGWWLQDDIQGATPRAYRLEALPPYTIAAASMHGGQPMLVSKDDSGSTGVEWRLPQVFANVLLRQEGRAPQLPIASMKGEFSTVDWVLHFPPAYRVIFAPGADEANGVWWNRWRLTQVLGVALLLLLSWRWGGVRSLVPAALLVLLSFHAPGMPVWSWGFALGLGLLAHAGLPGKLHKVALWSWYLVLAAWLLLAAFFAINQVKGAMYPQWMEGALAISDHATPTVVGQGKLASMQAGAYAEIASMEDAVAPAPMARQAQEKAMPVMAPPPTPMPSPPPQRIEESGAKISAGPGVPQWSSSAPVALSWQGPIGPQDTVKLWVAGPFLVCLGRWLSVALLLLVGWTLVRRPPASRAFAGRFRAPWKKAAAASLLCLALPLGAQAASVAAIPAKPQAPSVDVLDRLGQSIHPTPQCAPHCVSIAHARLSTSQEGLVVELEAHAQTRAALPLPVDADNALVLGSISQEGVRTPAVMQQGNGQWLQLPEGVSTVRLVYLARATSGTLRFEQNPGTIDVSQTNWSLSGIENGRLPSGILGWSRTVATQTPKDSEPTSGKTQVAIAPFVMVNRTIAFGPRWDMTVQVVRLAPQEGAFVVAVPLVAGEQPSQDLPRNDKGEVVVSFSPGQNVVSWSSTLPPKTALNLAAPDSGSVMERWTLRPGARFRVSAQGLPSLSSDDWTFFPVPGEQLTVSVSEPVPLEGQTVAIDQALLTQQWGPRGQSFDLSFNTRATTATDLMLEVPQDIELGQVQRNGSPVPGSRIEAGKLLLPAPPGNASWTLQFKNNQSPSWRVSSPQFKFNAPLANLTIVHAPGAKRWILDAQGPGKAPAVAYWPWLVVLVVLAMLLGRWRHSPLKTWQWVLLGLGFSVAAPWKVAVVGGWLIALDQRSRNSAQIHASALFNLIQVCLVVWTLWAVATIVGALPESLLASPDMKIYGEQAGRLTWFIDQVKSANPWPQASIVSLPIWVYRVLMLSWALWLAISALNWLRDGLRAWLKDGHWDKISLRARPVKNQAVPPQEPTPPEA